MSNPYVTLSGPYPLTWGEYITGALKYRLQAIKDHMRGVFTR
jgi:hypothetical protein